MLVAYSLYLVVPECPSSSPVGHFYCQTVESVHPFWDQNIVSTVNKLDARYGVSHTIEPYIDAATTHWDAVDARWGVSDAYKSHKLSLAAHVSTSWAYLETHVFPRTSRWMHEKTYDGCLKFQATVIYVEYHVHAGYLWARYRANEFRLKTVQPALYRGYVWFLTHPKVKAAEKFLLDIPAVAKLVKFLEKVAQKSSHINLHERTEFLKNELKNLIKSADSLKGFRRVPLADDDIVEVVKDILDDVSVNSLASGVLAVVESATAKAAERAKYAVEYATTKAAEHAEYSAQKSAEKAENVKKAAEEAKKALEYVENVSEETRPETELSEDEEPLTVHLTSTITVTQEDATKNEVATATANMEVALEDTVATKLELELLYWETKMDKMLTLTYNNLELEMTAFLDEIIGGLKQNLTAEFNALQLKTHQTYKDLNIHIGEINTEAEIMKSTNQSYEKPSVSRELVRQIIAEQRERPEKKIAELEKTLNQKNSEVLTKYFEVIQDTIDVLESFADTTVLEFSNRLTTLISILENEDGFTDELSWKAWRKFHKIKEEIFRIRDTIYNEANEYKEKLHHAKSVPKGLSRWSDYLKTVNFHINHILIENGEYLQLVRARANVAFQFREELVHEMKAAKIAAVEAEKQKEELVGRVSEGFEKQEGDLKEGKDDEDEKVVDQDEEAKVSDLEEAKTDEREVVEKVPEADEYEEEGEAEEDEDEDDEEEDDDEDEGEEGEEEDEEEDSKE